MSNFSRRHFGDVDIKELIQYYKQYDCLWNCNSLNYKIKSLKNEAWEDISNIFQKDVDDLKRKIRYLRCAYVAEKKKVDASRNSSNEYKPNLYYYKDLDFLEDVVVWRKFENNDLEHGDLAFENVDISQNEDDDEEEEIIPFENRNDSIEIKHPQISCKSETFMETEPLHEPETIINSSKISDPRSLASRQLKRKISDDIKLNSSSRHMTSSSNINLQFKNIYLSFGNTIALQLQQLPLDAAILAMSEIHTIITKKSLEHIRTLQNGCDLPQSESEDSYNELIEEAFNESS